MNTLFNLGFIFLPLSLVIRYFWTQYYGISFLAISNLQEWEKWVYGTSLLWFIFSVWNYAIRLRCPKCRSANVAHTGSREIDRWLGQKTVFEGLGDGKVKTKIISTTFEKIEQSYLCKDCCHKWISYEKREKQ